MSKDMRGYFFARERAASVAQKALDSGATPSNAVAFAKRVFDDYLALAGGSKGKSANSAGMTAYHGGQRSSKLRDIPACRFADNADVNGGLRPLYFRVKNDERAGVRALESFEQAAKLADLRARERAQACRNVVVYIRDVGRAKNSAARKHAISQVRAILHCWKGDTTVIEAARKAGWRV